jgi:hypothetical protein
MPLFLRFRANQKKPQPHLNLYPCLSQHKQQTKEKKKNSNKLQTLLDHHQNTPKLIAIAATSRTMAIASLAGMS